MKVIVPVQNQVFNPAGLAWVDYNDSIDWASTARGATASATSTAAGYAAANAITGSNLIRDIDTLTDCWQASATGTQTFTVTFAAPITLRRVRLVLPQRKPDIGFLLQEPTLQTPTDLVGLVDFVVQCQVSGVWTTIPTGSVFDNKAVLIDFLTGAISNVSAIRVTSTDTKPASFAAIGLLQAFGKEEDPWSSGTTYGIGANVKFGTAIYESLQAGNLNKTPGSTAAALWWLKRKPTTLASLHDGSLQNRFEGRLTSPGLGAPHLKLVLNVSELNFDTICLLDTQGHGVCTFERTERVYDSSNTLHSTTVIYTEVLDFDPGFSNFAFKNYILKVPDDFLGSMTSFPLGDYNTIRSTVTIDLYGLTMDSLGPIPKELIVGEIVVGREVDLGLTSYGFSAGITDYSVKNTDTYGNTTLNKRAFARRFSSKTEVDNGIIDNVHSKLNTLRATPCVWVASDDTRFNLLGTVYGFYKDFSTSIAYPTYSLCDLQIEGLT